MEMGRAIRPGELCFSANRSAIFVVGTDNTLLKVDIRSRRVLATHRSKHEIVPGMVLTDGELLVVKKQRKSISKKEDVVLDERRAQPGSISRPTPPAGGCA